jgi:hypothetical protein
MAALEEQKEEVGRSWDHMVKKKGTHVPLICDFMSMTIWRGLFIIHRELLIFFDEMSRMLLQSHELLWLGARY